MRILQGSCLCGACTYEVEDDFEYALICHCSQCRRATGAGSKPFAGIRAERLRVHAPERLLRYGESGEGERGSHDGHCARCGSLLFSLVREQRYVHVTLGTLLDSPTIRPSAHIFAGSKADWDPICDGLPMFDALPPD
ncbi:hypothetical protein EDF57_102187 [Novosphingobium sp. PhB55]|uniref:GFA family protein n=1 Tax=Novosphingobium sp. PhB55 TaxID=2485106 RepID=UPI0010655AA0|nr:GFA family protein [Novosphingobium sp. PhB55]TDW67303.1 hypothetical protein EDF57_102187 [Novosphingobium sp. PhB55]